MTTSTRPRGLSDLNPDLLRGYARRGLLGEALAWARRHLTGVHSAALCQALSEAYRERDAARERAQEMDRALLREQARSQEAIRLREKAAEAATDLRAALERERIRSQEAARLLEHERAEYARLRDAASLALEWMDEGAPTRAAIGIVSAQQGVHEAAQALRTALRRSDSGGPPCRKSLCHALSPVEEHANCGSKAPEVGRAEPWPGSQEVG